MKVLLDTNILLDYFLNRHGHSREVILKAVYGAYTACITTNMVTDIFYILSKNGIDARSKLPKFLQLFQVLDVKKAHCLKALELDMPDFEDALLVAVAREQQIDVIVTRNEQDFAHSQMIVYRPDEFLERLRK